MARGVVLSSTTVQSNGRIRLRNGEPLLYPISLFALLVLAEACSRAPEEPISTWKPASGTHFVNGHRRGPMFVNSFLAGGISMGEEHDAVPSFFGGAIETGPGRPVDIVGPADLRSVIIGGDGGLRLRGGAGGGDVNVQDTIILR
jgi:hypothetical protein